MSTLDKYSPTLESGIPHPLMEMVENELDRDEKIEWIDQPVPRFITKGTIPLLLIGTVWTVFTLFFVGLVVVLPLNEGKSDNQKQAARDENPEKAPKSPGGESSPFPGKAFAFLICTPHLLIGFGILSVPWWMRRSMRKTVYVITDRRAIIFEHRFLSMSIKSFAPDTLGKLHRDARRSGLGDVYFDSNPNPFQQFATNFIANPPGFYNIRNSKDVEKMLRDLKRNHEET